MANVTLNLLTIFMYLFAMRSVFLPSKSSLAVNNSCSLICRTSQISLTKVISGREMPLSHFDTADSVIKSFSAKLFVSDRPLSVSKQ